MLRNESTVQGSDTTVMRNVRQLVTKKNHRIKLSRIASTK